MKKNSQRMERIAQQPPFNFDIVFGFTDSIFVKVKEASTEEEEEIEEEEKLIVFYSQM